MNRPASPPITRPLVATLVWVAATLVGLAGPAAAQQPPAQIDPGSSETWDVIHTHDGNVLKGVIVEQVPGRNYRMVMPGGSTVNVPAGSIASISREANPTYSRPPIVAAAAPGPAAFYGGTQAPPTTSVSSGPSLPAPIAHEGWRFGFQVAPAFPTSDFGDRSLLNASTGFAGRFRFGYEYFFGNLGIEPGFAIQFDRFGQADYDGSYLYIGAQPTIKAQLHLGVIAPFATLALGFDHFREAGAAADSESAAGYNTSASGLGFDLTFGADVIVSPTTSVGIAWQLHPGFTSYHVVDGAKGLNLAFMSILFGVTYLM